MEISVAQAKNTLPKLIRAVEAGDEVVITRRGAPVARLTASALRTKVKFGTLKGRIKLEPGWDAPIDIDRFLAGEF